MSSTPNDLLQAIRAIIRQEAEHAVARALSATTRGHSQADGQRPLGVGKARYLRGWHRGHEAGDPEVWADGRARCMSAAAWARHGAAPRSKPAKTPSRSTRPQAVELRDDVLSELGLGDRRCG